MNRKRSARNAYIIMTCMAIVFILPLLWVIFASFNPDAGVGLKLPSTWVIENYQAVLSESKNVRSFGIGLALSIGVAALEVIVCALASYPLSRYELRYKKSFMPPLSSIVPRFEDEGYRAARELHAMMLTGRPPQHREISFGPLRIEERKRTSRTHHGGAIVQRALAFIDEHVLSGATVSDVVQHLNISWRLADLRFKEVTGSTIQSQLINARLEKVKEMLRDTDMHISDIARRCGCDVSVLRNLFRRHFGISMREFRKGIGEKQSSQSRGRR